MSETWKPVVGAPHYEVSDNGRVRSLDRVITGGNGRNYPHSGKVLKPTIATNGYPMVTIKYADGSRRNRTVHTLVAETFLGSIGPGSEVLHGDGIRTNAALSNLRYGTRRENYEDSVAHGTSVREHQEVCKRGHRMTAENLYLAAVTGTRTRTRRQCRTCANLTAKESLRVRRGFYERHPDAPHYV